ncbi:MarR family transcriptional regulator [Lactobacillus ginsenosidimutans] [Lactiplantibacillus mudanjiangensis]|uniref:MarR family winged helix-turn-helix transcriptional regulator n=1 Tax=Lactiplantibacillus mudanjiangensis TaxID=1296538 RepID=UPI001014B287|nr:MarR family winged helix-turn-helix transcriptional regulator [Lactiplantibacillus mudanjiangensis]VDG30882.1 MarR family transcriptional regulator [Lactobacillus ginsenosidimutans] [Lactiplantibacillus mudanjiangensis]
MPDVLRQIGTIARALDSISNREFQQLALSKGQYLYLVRICEQPGIIADRLAAQLQVDRTTAARAIQKLVTQGLVEKRAAINNRKNKALFPTVLGQRRAQVIERENQYSNQVALTDLTATEAEQLTHLLTKVSQRVTADWQTVKAGQSRPY